MSIDLSILMPSFNSEKFINFALDSIVKQKLVNAEVILIDGLSTDNTILIARDYAELINIKIISEPDDGVNDAFRKGLKLAQGKYVCALPSTDGYFDPNYLNSALHELEVDQDLRAVLAAGAFEIDEESTPLYQVHPWKNKFFQIFSWTHHKNLASSMGIILPDMGFVIERELFYKIMPDESTPLYGTSVTFLGVLKNLYESNAKFIVLPAIASYGRHHTGQWTFHEGNDQSRGIIDFKLKALVSFFSFKFGIYSFLLRVFALFIYLVLMASNGAIGYYIERIYQKIRKKRV
jgi:glycosyltransferase involved in cell wall biosynthesis